jgi:hypothetical protein
MATLSRLMIIYPLLFFFFLGQLGRLNWGQISFPILDICIVVLSLTNFLAQRKIVKPNKFLLIFLAIAIISNLIHLSFYPFPPLQSWAYLLRLISLTLLIVYPPKLTSIQNRLLEIVLFSSLLFGFIQYILWPDFTYFKAFNWDPHLYRLVGTFFDPTFTGLIFLFFLIRLYFSNYRHRLLFIALTYVGLALTYSRTSLLCFLAAFTFIAVRKKTKKIFFIALSCVLLTIIILPRAPGEGTKLERTSSIFAKIKNYQQGFKLFITSPISGVGYNNLPYLRPNPASHANSGFDGSLLTIAVTTGIFGLIFLCLGLYSEFTGGSFLYQTLLLILLVHSLFSNSLFYPWVTLLLALSKLKNHK